MISIIVPTYNERDNIKNLVSRLSHQFNKNDNYEIVVIDDNSTDGTWEILENLGAKYPLSVFKKEGKQGKAYSLFEGFAKAKGEILAMVDADLQYPPEAIPGMVKKLSRADIVVANRKKYQTGKLRKVGSIIFRFAFGKMLFGMNCDIQSGLKVFKREVAETVKFKPRSPWSFDLEFLHRAKQAGYKIRGFDIAFGRRDGGESKINFLKSGFELASASFLLKARSINPSHIAPVNPANMQGAGVGFRRRRYITHTTLHHKKSAIYGLVLWQRIFIFSAIFGLGAGFWQRPLATAIGLIGILSVIYFLDVVFNLFLIVKSLHKPPEVTFDEEKLKSLTGKELPTYSILCPLYREYDVLPNFLQAISHLDWPKDKLDVILLFEEDDLETLKVVSKMDLPSYVRSVVVPASNPKTKPKACNFGLSLAKGEYVVIFDAEDRPEPTQLKKAYLAFQKVGMKVVCLQAKLNYYNPHQNLLTRLFTAEYSLWFDVILTGLQSIETSIPLGGTSNHFRTRDLVALEGWDPFNVTEDADLGVRLFKAGYKTAIIDSITLEEANSNIFNWLRQRSRWIKGYMQTYLVHMRNPVEFAKKNGLHALIFQLVVGGKIAFMFINPFLWIATISYFALNRFVGPTIEALYPSYIFYLAAFSLVFGNFMFMYYYMIGCAKREHWSVIKYVFLVPIYWLFVSIAATKALYQLIFKPHFWEKTIHGYHFEFERGEQEKQSLRIATEAVREERIRKIRSLITSGAGEGGMLIASSIVVNFLNFLYNAYLGRTISVEDFGLISLFGSFIYLAQIVFGSLSKTVIYRSAYLFGQFETYVNSFWKYIRHKSIYFSFGVMILWLITSPLLNDFFHSSTWQPFILFAPVWIIGIVSAVDSGFLRGWFRLGVR